MIINRKKIEACKSFPNLANESFSILKLTEVRCSFVVKNFVIGKRQAGNVAVNGG